MQGKVWRYNQGGFGFIKCDHSKNLFFHISEVHPPRQEPDVGDLIEFTVSTDGHGRPCANDVRRISQPGNECGPVRFGDIGADEAA